TATDTRTGRNVTVTPIIVIDDIHHLVGSSRGQDGSMDVSHLLKPYIDGGQLRFIGTTTHEDYTRYVAKNKSLTRRFQQVEIKEPSVDETVEILNNHRKEIERFHHVSITEPIIRHAIELSAKYISDRFLPEKAIELLDEAATLTELRAPADSASKLRVKMTTVDEALANVAKIDAMAIKGDDLESLATLEERIKSQIFGQDEAIQKLVEAVQMSKSGLTDDGKPVASMLFVGPTGVGKTEVAKVLAKELGIELIRFDMSEYTEKHTVAKLIGSPAGYIGYDDGGLLTDAIRKTPYCVLLLDEIEKAHSDIYNILLQVMDYAQLTDNKGNKADFKNVILLMTSNAGAQHARKANIGFGGGVSTGEAMMKQVKQTFKPEFINRLSATVVFRDMDKQMAQLILDKKLKGFREKLAAKKVTLNLSAEAYEWLLEKGFTPEYGAREMDRVVAQYLKPLLMRSILFGKMKKGGEAVVSVKDGELWMK
ncbi:MAG: AAA family ATPase, partial [Bacteroidaceae bacterium]|nr:AAA family ATPase [Bacteroidaceae bacterium]